MSHYFTNDRDLKSEIKEIKYTLNNITYIMYTDNGIFSKTKLDYATKNLLKALDYKNISGDVLDFGCGYGPIGLHVKKMTDANVDMLDVNKRAVKLTRRNAVRNKIDINIFESDQYAAVDKKYDHIITNPPIRVGKELMYEILFNAKNYLKKDGKLWLVINKNQGAKSLLKDLEKEYNTEVIDKNKGFYVICCQNR
jgi:16S rRNA (guanine1207-N2)-methyltransferase